MHLREGPLDSSTRLAICDSFPADNTCGKARYYSDLKARSLKRWDAFISHASEDKDSVALPLAGALRNAGVHVWLDRFELRVGDSLREKIDEGLAESRFGIVILSPNFLAKGWPKRELNGLFALEESGHKVILPVWHNITKSVLAEHSPILADRLAADTSRGIREVAVELIAAILDPESGSPSVASPGLALRFNTLVEGTHELRDVIAFLDLHFGIILRAFGADTDASLISKSEVHAPTEVEDVVPDIAIGKLWRTTGRRSWEFAVFKEPWANALDDSGDFSKAIMASIAAIAEWREWISNNRRTAATLFSDITVDFPCTIISGRRGEAAEEKRRRLAELNDTVVGVCVRTYDWLIEAAAQLDERRAR
jgi:hypothetical protein